jgi:hypothetical protein
MTRHARAPIGAQGLEKGMVPGVNEPGLVQDGDLAGGVVIILFQGKDSAVARAPPDLAPTVGPTALAAQSRKRREQRECPEDESRKLHIRALL